MNPREALWDVPVSLTAALRQRLTSAKNLGQGDEDFGAVIELLAQWAGVAVRG